MRKILERNKILATNLVSKKGMKAKTEMDIAKVFPKSHIEDNTVAAKAFSNLNQHLSVDLFADSKIMETVNVEGFVHLNGQAVIGLNLFETANQAMSLYKAGIDKSTLFKDICKCFSLPYSFVILVLFLLV